MIKARQKSLAVLAAMLLALTIFFIFDDVLFYLLIERLLGWELNWLVKVGVWVILFLLNLGLALLVLKALEEKPQTGPESMIGEQGVVASIVSPHYWVKVRGELWRAKSNETLAVGDRVIVQKLESLTLQVERVPSNSNGGNS
jgi:membrane protein implicated in regulation of membrane protease activity